MSGPYLFSRAMAERGALTEPVQVAGLCPCPRCDAADIWPELAQGVDWALYCRSCQWSGPPVGPEAELDAALAAWNREARQVAEARALGLRLCFMQPPPSAEAAA